MKQNKLPINDWTNNHPVSFVKWVPANEVYANDYNPNSVAPPEMQLLQHSIEHDGFTQPIVTWKTDRGYEVIDGFHRHLVGKKLNLELLPIVIVNENNQSRNDRIASTIRHNRARGKHKIEAMSDIVIELKRRNWSDKRISKELGMDEDEILRLCQITGLVDVFADEQFSQSWDAIIMSDDEISSLDENDVDSPERNTNRIFHEWQEWECYPAGFYSDKPPNGMTTTECEETYRDFLANLDRFHNALNRLLKEWPISCEHYLTNEKMNRIAWLGQASMCLETGIPARFCGGYNLLTDEQKKQADLKALEFLNLWLKENGREELTVETAQSKTIANLY